MIKYSESAIGFYAEVRNELTQEEFLVTTFSTPFEVYETDIFRREDLEVKSDGICAAKPIFVAYASDLGAAKKNHQLFAERLEKSPLSEIISKSSFAGSGLAQKYRAEKIREIKKRLNSQDK